MNYNIMVDKIKEGLKDTEAFKYLSQKYGVDNKKLSDAEVDSIRTKLATPDARPMDFDGTFEAWLLRISGWGKIKITHKNPEYNINKTITIPRFLELVGDDERNAAYGIWNVGGLEINKILFSRQFWSINGKKIKEEIIVEIDLRADLKKRLKQVRKPFGF